MHVESLLTSLNEFFNHGPGDEPSEGDSAPIAAATSERGFDTASERDWCDLLRDVVALANSGGGQMVVRGAVGGPLDSAAIVRRLAEYTDSDFSDITVRSLDDAGQLSKAIAVGPATFPIGFTKSNDGMVSAGGFYFRHGDQSEPGTSADMRAFVERLLRRVRRRWLRGIRRVLAAPLGSIVGSKAKRTSTTGDKSAPANLQPVRIVTDPAAPALQPQDVDHLYPWRQKDLVRELNARLGRRMLNSYDVQAVRRHHRLDERPDFIFNLPGAGRRYSLAVAEWIMEQFSLDSEFFHHARSADHEMLRLRRQKPR